MNRVILIGRLTRDPELRYTTSNRAVCQFDLAVNRPFINQETNQKEVDFFKIILWGKQAENTAKYINKGSQIAIEGRIQTRSYDNSEGRKIYVTEVVASNVQFLDSKNNSQPLPTEPNNLSNKSSFTPEEVDNIPDDDLPF